MNALRQTAPGYSIIFASLLFGLFVMTVSAVAQTTVPSFLNELEKDTVSPTKKGAPQWHGEMRFGTSYYTKLFTFELGRSITPYLSLDLGLRPSAASGVDIGATLRPAGPLYMKVFAGYFNAKDMSEEGSSFRSEFGFGTRIGLTPVRTDVFFLSIGVGWLWLVDYNYCPDCATTPSGLRNGLTREQAGRNAMVLDAGIGVRL